MELNWNQEDSIYSFFKDPNDLNGNGINNVQYPDNPLYSNPLKINSNSSKHSEFKIVPLPDDIFGFDPEINQQKNIQIATNNNNNPLNLSFNIDNYLKADIDTDFNTVPGFNDIIEPEFVGEDIEKVLLDLGISEPPSKDPNFQPQDNNETNKRNTHKRQLSGSAIFGFVGEGDNTQLSIPGVEPVQFINKKPMYKDITNLNNLSPTSNNRQNQSNSNYYESNTPFTPKKQKTTTQEKPDYYVSTGNPKSYKFPPSPPRGTFSFPNKENTTNEVKKTVKTNIFNPGVNTNCKPLPIPIPVRSDPSNESQLENLQIFTSSPLKSTSQTPIPTSPLNNIPTSSPLKNNLFQTPLTSPRKNNLVSQIGTQSKFKISKSPLKTEDTTILLDDNDENDNDKTISEMATPLKRSNVTYDYMNTPTKMKVLFSGSTATDGSTKENGSPQRSYLITQKMKGFNKRSMVRKKPTIASTLATGTLDQYFVGPDENKKFICKFFDKEVQSVCNREFGRISNIRAHIQTHLSDRPFVCDICQKAFVRNHDLKRHKNSHTGVANTCPCGKTFPRADALKRHRMRNICIGGIERDEGVIKPTDNDNSKITDKLTAENVNQLLNSINKDQNFYEDKNQTDTINSHHRSHRSSIPQITERIPLQPQSTSHRSSVPQINESVPSQSNPVPVFNGYQREETPIIQTRTEIQKQQADMTALFNFSEIPVIDGDFDFELEDSLVM